MIAERVRIAAPGGRGPDRRDTTLTTMAKAREIPGLDGAMPYAHAAALTVEVRAREVFDHAHGVLDTNRIEGVHDMRVATRRLRAVLEVYAPCFPKKELQPVLRDVKALADALGARRDPDVELLALEQFAASVGPGERAGVEVFITRTRAEQRDGNAILERALEEMRAGDLEGRLRRLAASAAAPEDEPEEEPGTHDVPEGEHPHGLGRLDAGPRDPGPANVNTDTGW
jgi:CHAD domain-containing protein